MGARHSEAQKASGGAISQARVRDAQSPAWQNLYLRLISPHGRVDLQGPGVANAEHLSGTHVYK